MCFDFLTNSFQGSDVYIKGKKREDFFNFSDYFLLYFKYFYRVWASQIHINFENLKKLLLKRTQNDRFSQNHSFALGKYFCSLKRNHSKELINLNSLCLIRELIKMFRVVLIVKTECCKVLAMIPLICQTLKSEHLLIDLAVLKNIFCFCSVPF